MTRVRRRTPIAVAVAFAIAPLAFVACGDDGTSAGDGAPATTAASSAAPAKAATVVIKDVRFVDAKVAVAVGGTVTFDNQDNQAHTASGDASGGFDTDTLAAGAKGTVTFDRAGTYTYHCAFHPFMVGTVVVS